MVSKYDLYYCPCEQCECLVTGKETLDHDEKLSHSICATPVVPIEFCNFNPKEGWEELTTNARKLRIEYEKKMHKAFCKAMSLVFS